MLQDLTTTGQRVNQLDPAGQASNIVRAALLRAVAMLHDLAELNPTHASTIRERIDEMYEHSGEMQRPLESLSDDLREAWLRGELREPADDAGA